MSIASRITSIEDHIKNDYNALERLGADLINVDKNIENIASVVNDIYNKLPKVTGTGSNLSLSPTLKGALGTIPLGNCEQTGTPTPDNLIDIKVVTGDNQVLVQNENLVVYDETEVTLVKSTNRTINITPSNFPLTLPAGTYTFYIPDLVLTNFNYFFRCTIAGNSYNIINKFCTLILAEETTIPSLYIFISNSDNDNATATFSKLMILKGSYTVDTLPNYIQGKQQSTTLHLGTLELCKIGDYQDYITGTKNNWKVVRNVRHLSLAITDMNNLENYPGWQNVSNIVNDLSLTANTRLYSRTSFRSNIENHDCIYVNQNATMWLLKDYFNLTQTQWKTNYPNLIFDLYYGITNQSAVTEETITDTTLINELNELQELLSYDGTTNITITSNSNNAQMLVQVSALKGE